MKSFELTLFADYFQFYIQDEAANGDLSDAWNKETTERFWRWPQGRLASVQYVTWTFPSQWRFSNMRRTMTPLNGIMLLKLAWTWSLDGS